MCTFKKKCLKGVASIIKLKTTFEISKPTPLLNYAFEIGIGFQLHIGRESALKEKNVKWIMYVKKLDKKNLRRFLIFTIFVDKSSKKNHVFLTLFC